MSRHTDEFSASALPALMDHFGEEVTFSPYGGSPRTIDAIVTRQMPVPLSEVPTQLLPNIDVWIRRHATNGALTINVNQDTITTPVQIGGSAVAQLITDILFEDASWFHLSISH